MARAIRLSRASAGRRSGGVPFALAVAAAFALGAGLVIAGGWLAPPAAPALFQLGTTIEGYAEIIDGDTIDVAGIRIRLFGVDAPEGAQHCGDAAGRSYACGRAATEALIGFLAASEPVWCTVVDIDRYDRAVSRCRRADGVDVGGWLAAQGWALDYAAYSGGAYAAEQASAAAAGRGLWQGDFVAPWDWRVSGTAAAAPAPPAAAGCAIKGNISASGERIYHLPGQQYYDATVIDPGRGERWFCSEADAVAAGWRRALV